MNPFFLDPGPVVLYGRVSTADQTVETQDAALRSYITRFPELQFDPELVFLDPDTSGGIPLVERESGSRLVSAIELRRHTSQRIRHLVVMRLDRLGRDAIDIIGRLRWLWDNDVTPHFVDMGPMAKSPLNEAALSIGAVFAQLERDLIRARTCEKMQRLRQQGRPTGGTLPYGWQLVGDRWVPHPDEQHQLALMRDLERAGWNYNRIMRDLNARGIPSKTGKAWTYSAVQSALTAKINQPLATAA